MPSVSGEALQLRRLPRTRPQGPRFYALGVGRGFATGVPDRVGNARRPDVSMPSVSGEALQLQCSSRHRGRTAMVSMPSVSGEALQQRSMSTIATCFGLRFLCPRCRARLCNMIHGNVGVDVTVKVSMPSVSGEALQPLASKVAAGKYDVSMPSV